MLRGMVDQDGQVAPRSVGQQVAGHPVAIVEEVDGDLGVDAVGGQQVEGPRLVDLMLST